MQETALLFSCPVYSSLILHCLCFKEIYSPPGWFCVPIKASQPCKAVPVEVFDFVLFAIVILKVSNSDVPDIKLSSN